MKNLSKFSVSYPVTVFMAILAIILLGTISLSKLGMDLFPDLNSPRLYILLEAGERPPEEIEKNYTDNLEALAIRQSDVVEVSSISKVGSAQITVEYEWDKDMDAAFLELQKATGQLTQNWDVDELSISQYDPNSSPIMIVAMSHQDITDMSGLRKTAENYIRNELIRLEGIADVEISGAEKKEVIIKTTPYILKAHGLSMADLASQVERFNRNVSGGSIVELGKQYIIKGISVYENLENFGNTIIKYTQAIENDSIVRAPVFLKDIAEIEYSNAEPENIVHLNGKRCIGLEIYKENKYNSVEAVADIQETLVKIESALPRYEFVIVQNQGSFIQASIDEVIIAAILGIVFAVFVLFIFLRRIGTTLIIAISIPISIMATFSLMYFNELSLNIMTLGGLALGAGMLVDNAIVVVENIFRNIENGLSVKDAAIKGTAEVGSAITASTITTIIVFLPIVYLQGASGELFKDQALTVTFSLLSSLVVAMLVIPMLSSKFLKNAATDKKQYKSVAYPKYPVFLNKVLNKRWLVIITAILLVAATAFIIPVIGSEFMPKTASKVISIDLRFPVGTELKRTESTIATLENIFKDLLDENITNIYSVAGPVSGISNTEDSFFEDTNTGNIKLIIANEEKSNRIKKQIEDVLVNVPELEFKFVESESPLSQILGTEDFPIIIEISGEDLEIIEKLSNEVAEKLNTLSSLTGIESGFQEGTPVVEIEIDRLRSGVYNVGIQEITTQLQEKLEGRIAGEWDFQGELNDIRIKIPDIAVSELEDITIISNNAEYRLAELAHIKIGSSPKEIIRRNQTRIGKITAQINSDQPFDKIIEEIRSELSSIEFPINYKAKVTGEEELRQDSMGNLTFALILSVILVYMALASQFESLVHPFTILLTIPLASVGGVLIFLIIGMPFNIMAYIGLIMLTGIAVNDSIILVDAINQLKNEGMQKVDAILSAAGRRIRPIIMTSLTTVLALVPLTFGFDESSSLRSPMAYAVIGGLVTSTMLTLIVIPCVYYVLDSFRDKVSALVNKEV